MMITTTKLTNLERGEAQRVLFAKMFDAALREGPRLRIAGETGRALRDFRDGVLIGRPFVFDRCLWHHFFRGFVAVRTPGAERATCGARLLELLGHLGDVARGAGALRIDVEALLLALVAAQAPDEPAVTLVHGPAADTLEVTAHGAALLHVAGRVALQTKVAADALTVNDQVRRAVAFRPAKRAA